MADFRLPDLGEGVTEAEIERWLVGEGDAVAEDDLLVEVVTDKATAEIPSPYAGTVARIHVGPGEIVPVGTVLVTISEGDQAGGRAPGGRAGAEPPPPPPPPPAGAAIRALPPVRRLARELGVDLTAVTGTGAGGQITRGDVELAAGAGVQGVEGDGSPRRGQPPSAGAGLGAHPGPSERAAEPRRRPLTGVRRMIAERMTAAHTSIPAVTHVEECDVTELDETRRLFNARNPAAPRLTYLPFVVAAAAAALRDFPVLNASVDDAAGEIVLHDRVDIGIAVDTEAGLVVPVVRDAGDRGVTELAADIDRLAAAARAGSLAAEQMRGGTFTITSPGPFGGIMATPIILPPQTGILGVHRAVDRPVVRDGAITVRKIMNLSITFDHRALDGVTAARFCLEVVRLLEHPALMLLRG